MSKKRFVVGDRVEALVENDYINKGDTGVIIGFSHWGTPLVEWNNPKRHSSLSDAGGAWYANMNSLRKVS